MFSTQSKKSGEREKKQLPDKNLALRAVISAGEYCQGKLGVGEAEVNNLSHASWRLSTFTTMNRGISPRYTRDNVGESA